MPKPAWSAKFIRAISSKSFATTKLGDQKAQTSSRCTSERDPDIADISSRRLSFSRACRVGEDALERLRIGGAVELAVRDLCHFFQPGFVKMDALILILHSRTCR